MIIPLVGEMLLYIIIGLYGMICLLVLAVQLKVIRGGSFPNCDGSVDDWHEQKIFFGIAFADLVSAVPVSLAGIVFIFFDWRVGYYLVGLGCFWSLWANIMTTATSLRFEKPKMTLMWFIQFPFGSLVGLAYIVWSLIYFDAVF